MIYEVCEENRQPILFLRRSQIEVNDVLKFVLKMGNKIL
jgi:hypothetical protein